MTLCSVPRATNKLVFNTTAALHKVGRNHPETRIRSDLLEVSLPDVTTRGRHLVAGNLSLGKVKGRLVVGGHIIPRDTHGRVTAPGKVMSSAAGREAW